MDGLIDSDRKSAPIRDISGSKDWFCTRLEGWPQKTQRGAKREPEYWQNNEGQNNGGRIRFSEKMRL